MKVNFNGRWSESEKARFLVATSVKNRSWKEISEIVGTRTAAQCRSHNQKLNKSKKTIIKVEPISKNIEEKEIKIEPLIEETEKSCKFASKMVQCDLLDCSSSEPLIPLLINAETTSGYEIVLQLNEGPLDFPFFSDEDSGPLDDLFKFIN